MGKVVIITNCLRWAHKTMIKNLYIVSRERQLRRARIDPRKS